MKIHIVAGILIGYFNAAWSMLFVAAVVWGVFYCLFMLRTYKGRKEQYMEKLKALGKEKQFGLPPHRSFYVYEFICATGISYAIGMVAFAMRSAM